ncbi:MAG: DUF4149 domain-containing protein [Phycisphaeraceae bacterium]
MRRATAFRLTQGVYYLALGAWFGALVMLVVAAATTFRTLEALVPAAETGAGAASMVSGRGLAGTVVGETIRGLNVVQMVCGVTALVCLALQVTLFRDRLAGAGRSRVNALRGLLVAGAFAVLLANVFWIGPGVRTARAAMDDAAAPAAEREQMRADFQWYHRLSERTTGGAGLMLAVAVVISPFAFRMTPAPAVVERRLARSSTTADKAPTRGGGAATGGEGASAYE